MGICELIEEFKNNPNFEVKEPCGYPELKEGHIIPDDMREFYSLCGGILCYVEDGGFPIEILEPQKVKHSNSTLLGEECQQDISFSWYLIVDAEDGNYLSIDCDALRLGKCYESFEYSHAVKDFCPIVALSFTDMLNNILNYKGEYFYWKNNTNFKGYGDAYQSK